MNDQLAELISMYDAGAWSRDDFLFQILLVVPAVSIETVIEQLPTAICDDFVQWLRDTYENEVPLDDFISIGRNVDAVQDGVRLEMIRAWLRANPKQRAPDESTLRDPPPA